MPHRRGMPIVIMSMSLAWIFLPLASRIFASGHEDCRGEDGDFITEAECLAPSKGQLAGPFGLQLKHSYFSLTLTEFRSYSLREFFLKVYCVASLIGLTSLRFRFLSPILHRIPGQLGTDFQLSAPRS